MQPTTLVIHFNEGLSPAQAQSAAEYQIVTLGGPGRGGSRVGQHTALSRALYDPSTNTVTLETATRLDVHNRYRLMIAGSTPGGLSDTAGRLLDGKDNGVPGSDFVTIISFKTLAGAAPASLSSSGVSRGRHLPRPGRHPSAVAAPRV
jgi:type VI secretion system secreted protein VgrG